MAGKARYSEEQKKEVYLALAVNEGNVKATARETGLPEQTIRNWKKAWMKPDGKPTPASDEEVGEAAIDFLEDATRIRNKLLMSLEEDIEEMTPRDKMTGLGILTDKIDRAMVVAHRANSGGDVHIHLPTPESFRDALGGLVQGALQAAHERRLDIIDADVVEQPRALPA